MGKEAELSMARIDQIFFEVGEEDRKQKTSKSKTGSPPRAIQLVGRRGIYDNWLNVRGPYCGRAYRG